VTNRYRQVCTANTKIKIILCRSYLF